MQTDVSGLKSNIPKVLWINGFWMFLVLMPVIVPFLQAHQLSMSQIYFLQTIFAVLVVVLEIPSGYIADLLGRKRTIVCAALFNGLGFTVLTFSEDYYGFVIFEVLVAIAASLISGADLAMIYDSAAALDSRRDVASSVLGRKIFYSQIGETVAALLGGALALYSLDLPAKVNAVTAWIPFLIALTLVEPPRELLSRTRHRENFSRIYRQLFVESRLLRLILFNLIAYGTATLVAVWAFQGYWREIDVPLHYFGYLWAGYNLTVALTGRVAHLVERRLGSPAAIALTALLPVAGYLGMGFAGGWVGILFGLAFQVSRGLNQVIFRDALNARVSAAFRATANSIASLGVRMSFAFLGPLMGYLIDIHGYESAFRVFAAVFAAVLLLLCVPLLALRRTFRPLA